MMHELWAGERVAGMKLPNPTTANNQPAGGGEDEADEKHFDGNITLTGKFFLGLLEKPEPILGT